MPVRFLSDAELSRLSSWPDEIAAEDLVTYFTLTGDDLSWLRTTVRAENRLGAAVQLCALPWLGWIPDDLRPCPEAAVRRLAQHLRLADKDVLGLLAAYGGWEGRTRRDHRVRVLDRLGWRALGAGDRKQLEGFLLARALDMTLLACCLRWPVTGCATSGSSARRWTRCRGGWRLPATAPAPRPSTGSRRCWLRRVPHGWTGCWRSTRTSG